MLRKIHINKLIRKGALYSVRTLDGETFQIPPKDTMRFNQVQHALHSGNQEAWIVADFSDENRELITRFILATPEEERAQAKLFDLSLERSRAC